MYRYRSMVARVRRTPSPLQCATFDPLPGRVLTTISVRQAGDDDACVAICRDLETYAVRAALATLEPLFPRGAYRYLFEAKVV